MSVPLTSIQSIDSPVMDSGRKDKIGSSEVWYNAEYESIMGGYRGRCQWICSDYL
jgi:hypothetical protein